MHKALIIGCGNIGALYDIDNNDSILTHAKAFHENEKMAFDVYDKNEELARKVAKKYDTKCLTSIEDKNLGQYDLISICTPTNTHYHFLKKLLLINTPVIICEKPISTDRDELNELKVLYANSSSKVIVNYIRRFHINFIELKKNIKEAEDQLVQVTVNYSKGLINNASHIFDLLNFLLDDFIKLADFQIVNRETNTTFGDETVTMFGKYRGINFSFIGLLESTYPQLEVELFLKKNKIILKNGGDTIKWYKPIMSSKFAGVSILAEHYTIHNAINNYMKHVVEHALHLLENKAGNDNFNDSIALNIELLNGLGKQSNGKQISNKWRQAR